MRGLRPWRGRGEGKLLVSPIMSGHWSDRAQRKATMALLRGLAADVIEGLVVFEGRQILEISGGVDGSEDLFLSAGGQLASFAGFLHHLVRQTIVRGGGNNFMVIDAAGFKRRVQGLNPHEHVFGVGLSGFFGFGGHGLRMEQKVTKDRKA